MEALEARGRAAAEAAVARAVARVAEAAADLPGVRVAVEADAVVLSGRGLARVAGLRWIGGLLR